MRQERSFWCVYGTKAAKDEIDHYNNGPPHYNGRHQLESNQNSIVDLLLIQARAHLDAIESILFGIMARKDNSPGNAGDEHDEHPLGCVLAEGQDKTTKSRNTLESCMNVGPFHNRIGAVVGRGEITLSLSVM